MKQLTNIALFKGSLGRKCKGILCAILVFVMTTTSLLAQEPELITPQEAKDIYEELTADSVAVEEKEESNIEPLPYIPEEGEVVIIPEDTLTADSPAIEESKITTNKDKNSTSQAISYAKRFWDEAEEEYKKHEIEITGTKTFEFKYAKVKGDVSHFSTEHNDCYPGTKINQSLHLEIDGKIDSRSTVHAVLDDTEEEDRKFLVSIESGRWKYALGDFPFELKGSKFAVHNKELRGVMAQGRFRNKLTSTFVYAQSKGLSRREQFRGAGAQQEYRMQAAPIIQESEKVYIDNVPLVRGSDYQIDYEEGIVKFMQSVLPIEMTRWIVVEYESKDEEMAFKRTLLGTRQEYAFEKDRRWGVTWLREFETASRLPDETASGTLTPMQHDVYETDLSWRLGKGFALKGEYAVSQYDPNRHTDKNPEDKKITGHAASINLSGKTQKLEAGATYDRVDKAFKTIGRETGVVELGERGLVDDIISSKVNFTYKFNNLWSGFANGEKSKTNIDNDLTKSKVNYNEFNTGFIWEKDPKNRFEVRTGRKVDEEIGPSVNSDLTKDASAVVYDRQIGKIRTQAKAERTAYTDDINIASDSKVLELNFNISSEVNKNFAWSAGASRITVQDEIVLRGNRSETSNYNMTVNYEPNDKLRLKGEFQFRREDDNFSNSREDSQLADSTLTYEPDDDFKTTFKYKVENTSKITKDENLDIKKYILPSSLPEKLLKEDEVLTRFENPVAKITMNSTTDYQMNKNWAAYIDWRRRNIDDKKTGLNISKTDRQTYELRYTPEEKLSVTTEYEKGYSVNHDSVSEINDSIKSVQVRKEFEKGYILDATYEETEEDDTYVSENDQLKKSTILGLQRPINKYVTWELGLQHNDIDAKNPSKEFEKRLALTLTPSSKNQRYKFFANHKDIDAKIKGTYYEGGVTFSQFIGTDTIIDGEIKKVHSSRTLSGEGYDAVVANAKVVITF